LADFEVHAGNTLEYKVLGASAILLNPIGGAIVGFYLGLAEEGMAGIAGTNPSVADPPPAPPQSDQAPSPGDFGLIIGPAGVTPPNGVGVEQQVWPQFDPALDEGLATTIDGRTYSLWLGGMLAVVGTRPAWLPSDDLSSGYQGRWGNRVTSDPFGRRAGMFFPAFWSKFFAGLAKALIRPLGARMFCTRCGYRGADARPGWSPSIAGTFSLMCE
jgi:hypothetical protein